MSSFLVLILLVATALMLAVTRGGRFDSD
jgi:hypothetical protein